MKRIVIIGSNGTLARNYVDNYPDNYLLLDKSNTNYLNTDVEGNEFKFDANNSKDLEDLAEYCQKKSLKITGIIFFQGINLMNDFFSVTSNEWDLTFNSNLKSSLFILKYLFPHFYKKCSIVVIASQNGVVAHEQRIDYGTSKAALIHLIKNLSIEFSKLDNMDVKLNAISPGYVYSERGKKYLDSYKGEKLRSKIPYKRFVLPEDIAHTISFLMSSKSDAIRGQNIIVDYGYTLP